MTEQRPQAFDQLKEQLKEMFQLDRGDLDFGIYRIMNQKRDEVTKFLEKQLLPQVQSILKNYEPSGMLEKKKELQEAEANPNKYSTAYIEDLQKAVNESVDVSKLEQEIYSDLHNFFKRYYSEGDFMSLRRYKEGVYALPYEGEEVKLHWANHDQYYIKTSENLKNYSFKTPSGKRVRFEVVAGGTETNNNKAAEGKDRRFLLHKKEPLVATADELTIRFEYRPDDSKQKQDKINEETLEDLLNLAEVTNFGLNQESPTEKNLERTLLEKYLTDFTAKNTFDYFIHKDLGGFLRRELDFYIKNEIIHLDDIESEAAPRVEAYLAKVKAMRKVASKIIQFLAQLEDFQKKLWLKKKFVLETHYCITLNHIIGSEVEEILLPVIITNDNQRKEWVKLFAIDELNGYTTPLTENFLKTNDKLLLDTKFFNNDFKYTLLSVFDNLDEQTGGVMIHSENFQALNLLHNQYKEKVKCIYIDPPYNSDASEIIYKNGYKHSSWLTLMENRYQICKNLVTPDGVISTAIDDIEFHRLESLNHKVFGAQNHVTNLAIMHNPKGRDQKYVSVAHEYTIFFAKDKRQLSLNRLKLTDQAISKKYPKTDKARRYRELPLRRSGTEANRTNRPYMYFAFLLNSRTKKIGIIYKEEFRQIFVDKKFNDQFVEELKTRYENAGYDFILPIRDDGSLGRWRWGYDKCLKYIDTDLLSIRGKQAPTVYVRDYMDDTYLPKSLWFGSRYDASTKGTNLLKDMIPNNPFDYPKSIFVVQDIVYMGSSENSFILDYFAGSGTTGHAVININREYGSKRKYILVEMGEHFASITKQRVLKAAYSKDWEEGKPVLRDGISQIVKYMALEQYEDTLDNLRLNTTATLLTSNPALNEQYTLGYMLDVESRGSQSLLNIDAFVDPFAYKLEITRNDDTQKVNVDLVETFNYLLGLTIRTVTRDKCGIVTITGTNSLGENCLIIWRNADEIDNNNLDTWFEERRSSEDFDFDAIYVNGDSNIENMKPADEHWHVRLIEAEFKNLMFDTKDV